MMSFFYDLWERIIYVLRGSREADDLRSEMEHHLQMEIEHNVRLGLSGDDARRVANTKFGNIDHYAEITRDASGVGRILDFANDIKHALRGMRRAPGFAVVAVATLGVGIAIATVVFSMADHLLYRHPTGLSDPQNLALIYFGSEDISNHADLSYPNFRSLSDNIPSVLSMTSYVGVRIQAALGTSTPETLEGQAVIGDYFGTLGAMISKGRAFSSDELTGTASPRVAIISYELWRRAFREAHVLGSVVHLNAVPYTIVGVAPKGFTGPIKTDVADIWIPGAGYSALRHSTSDRIAFDNRSASLFRETIARLREGVSPEVVQQQAQLAVGRLINRYPKETELLTAGPVTVYKNIGLLPDERDYATKTVHLLMLIGAFVLVVACANVANLLLFRAVGMRGESAIRRALGASGGRLLQHYMAQGVVFGTAAALIGIVFSKMLIAFLRDTGVPVIGRLEHINIDGRVLVFALFLGAATSVVFAVVPTFLAQTVRLTEQLQTSHRTETGRLIWIRRLLVVMQVALAAALIIPGAMLAKTVRNLSHQDMGVRTRGLMAFGISTEPQGYDENGVLRLQERVLHDVASLPEIVSVTLTNANLLSEGGFFEQYVGPLQGSDGEPVRMHGVGIGRNYFETLGIRIERGRSFNASEDNVPGEAIGDEVVINHAAAVKLFGTTDVIGRTIAFSHESARSRRIIGVVADSRLFGLRSIPRPAAYRPVSEQWFRGSVYIVVRTRANEAATQRALSTVVNAIDPNIPFFRVRSMADEINDAMARERMFARLAVILSTIALILAGIGIYGMMAYAVAGRVREIGIRMALGARRSGIVAAVTAESVAFALAGSVLGWFGGEALAGILRSMLFGISPLDMWVYVSTAGVFIVVAFLSTIMPARSAAAVQPASALRSE